MRNLFYNIENKYMAVVIFITAMFLFLFSCSNLNNSDNLKYLETIVPVTYINGAKDGFREQQITDLYENAGIKSDRIFMRDAFNLKLSHNNYFYTDDISVEITSDLNNIEIYYSLDGSNPSREKVGTGKKNGIPIGSRKYTEPIILQKTDYNDPYVLRFTAYSDDVKSQIITHTYFVSENITERFDENTYVFSITSDPYNLFDYENGILIEGKLRDDYKSGPRRVEVNPGSPANYNMRGRESERDAYAEVFKSGGRLLISQPIGIRVHGGWSRGFWNGKSLRLYARQELDPVFDKFYYPFFGEHKRNDKEGSLVTNYPVLLLRNGGNDYQGAFMREEYSQSLAQKAGFIDYKVFAPAAVFLNGEYYGFFWLQTHYDEKYFMNMYGGDNKNDFDIVELWEEPDSGTLTNDDEFEKYIDEIIDIDNYMLYYAFEIYSNNWDWPHNNRKLWRYNAGDGDSDENGTEINQYFDGKLRMLIYDVEAWGLYGNNASSANIQRVSDSVTSFRRLMRRPDMVEKFCNQMFDLINTVFTYETMEEELNRMVSLYEHEINIAVQSKVLPNTVNNLQNSRRLILKFADNRAVHAINDMANTFKIKNSTYDVKVKGGSNIDITLNTIKLNGAGEIKSCYFTEHSVVLKADPSDGYIFDRWEINGKIYYSPEVILKSNLAENGVINAAAYIK